MTTYAPSYRYEFDHPGSFLVGLWLWTSLERPHLDKVEDGLHAWRQGFWHDLLVERLEDDP